MATLTLATLNKMIAEKGATVTLEGAKFRITSIEQAVQLFTDYRDAEGDWKWEESHSANTMCKTDGYIAVGNKVVARISYNGRIWKGNSSVSITETKMEI